MDDARGCLGVGAMILFLFTVVLGWIVMTVIPVLGGEKPIANIGLLIFWTIVSLVIWRLAAGKGWGLSSEVTEKEAEARSSEVLNSASALPTSKEAIPTDWARELRGHGIESSDIEAQLVDAYYDENVLPSRKDVFRAFRLTSFSEVKVVVLGQDPYPEPGLADGLAFSVRKGTPIPRSLAAIFRALASDPILRFATPPNGSLARWAKQGVLLCNSALTVEKHDAGSHLTRWSGFTLGLLRTLNARETPIVFLLFGDEAVRLGSEAQLSAPHRVIRMAHPVAWSNTGLPKVADAQAFSEANDFLRRWGRSPIDW